MVFSLRYVTIRILYYNKSFYHYNTDQKLDDRDFSYFLHGAFVFSLNCFFFFFLRESQHVSLHFFRKKTHLQHVTIIQKNGSPGESIRLVLCCRNKSIHVRFRDSSDKNSSHYMRPLFLKTLPHSVDACSSIRRPSPTCFPSTSITYPRWGAVYKNNLKVCKANRLLLFIKQTTQLGHENITY